MAPSRIPSRALAWATTLSVSLPIGFFLSTSVHADAAKLMNPDIGANFLGLYNRSTRFKPRASDPASSRNGFILQEAELSLMADVDPYFRGIVILAVEPEWSSTGGKLEYKLDPEEVYFETIALPTITLKAGRFRAALGKHNQLHTHAFPFIDAPLVNRNLLGDDGLDEVGASASALLPTSWFSELTIQALSAENSGAFLSNDSGDPVGVGRYRNLWELSDALTAELSVSGALGKNSLGTTTNFLGGDLTFKSKPTEGPEPHGWFTTVEFLRRRRALDPAGEQNAGASAWIEAQVSRRWWVGVRGEYLGIGRSRGVIPQNGKSALIGFLPSEFSGWRLQYDHRVDHALDGGGSNEIKPEHKIALQYNLSIGAHPAHNY